MSGEITETSTCPSFLTWETDQNNPPGPRQVSAFQKTFRRLSQHARTFTELTGTVGDPDSESRHSFYSPFSAPGFAAPVEAANALHAEFGGVLSRSNIREVTAALAEAAARPWEYPVVDKRRSPAEVEELARKRAANEAKMAEARAERERGAKLGAEVLAKLGGEVLIVAEARIDDSDSMTDYFASHTDRTVIIGTRRGRREDFEQLRAAAATFEPTEHLGPDADPKVEHRDNYSMGQGNYLQEGWSNSGGWRVRSMPAHLLSGPVTLSPAVEARMSGEAPEDQHAAGETAGAGEGWNVVERVHTKKGHTYYQVELQARVSREEFVRLRDSAKAAGGWYSRQWAGIPGGFAFAEAEDARQWAASEFGGAA